MFYQHIPSLTSLSRCWPAASLSLLALSPVGLCRRLLHPLMNNWVSNNTLLDISFNWDHCIFMGSLNLCGIAAFMWDHFIYVGTLHWLNYLLIYLTISIIYNKRTLIQFKSWLLNHSNVAINYIFQYIFLI